MTPFFQNFLLFNTHQHIHFNVIDVNNSNKKYRFNLESAQGLLQGDEPVSRQALRFFIQVQDVETLQEIRLYGIPANCNLKAQENLILDLKDVFSGTSILEVGKSTQFTAFKTQAIDKKCNVPFFVLSVTFAGLFVVRDPC